MSTYKRLTDDTVLAIEFLNNESNRLRTTTFFNLFNSHLKWSTGSYIESIFASDQVASSYLSTYLDLLEISLEKTKSIHSLDDFDKYISEGLGLGLGLKSFIK